MVHACTHLRPVPHQDVRAQPCVLFVAASRSPVCGLLWNRYAMWHTTAPTILFDLSLVAMVVAAMCQLNFIGILQFACTGALPCALTLAWLASDEPLLCSLSTRSVYYSRYVGRSLRVRGLLIFSIVTLAYGYAGVLGWPPFLHARLGSSLPWSRNASPQHQVGACGLPCQLCVGRAKCGPHAVTNQRCVLACGSTWLASARMWLGGNSSPDTWPSCLHRSRRTSSGGSSA